MITTTANVGLEVGPNGSVLVKPLCFLGYPKFDEYRDACKTAGCTYDPDVMAHTIARTQALGVYERLSDLGFTVDIDVRLRDVLEAAREASDNKDTGAQAHLARIQIDLAERGLKLHPYQCRAVTWLHTRNRALLGDEMGIGKTPELLCALPPAARAMICVPAALKYMWKQEIEKFRPDLTPVVLKGRAAFRWPEPGEAVIFNYELLPRVRKRGRRPEVDPDEWPTLMAELPDRIHLIADEAHYLKNGKAKRSVKFRTIATAILKQDGSIWLATGTPMMRAPTDLWHILRAASLETDAFRSWPNFCTLFKGEKGEYGFEWGEPDPTVPALLQRVMLRRLRVDVLPDLPPKTYHTIPVDGIDRKTKRACDEVLEALEAAGVELSWAVLNTDLSEDTLVFQKLAAARAALAAAKIKHMMAIVDSFEEQQEPLVVFSSHRAPIDFLCEKKPGFGKIVGGMDPKERARVVKEFQAGRLNGIAATIGAGGVGITLTQSHHLLHVSLDFNPANNHQAEDRICRHGQEHDAVFIHTMIADHELDQRITEILVAKQRVIEASMKATEDAEGNRIDHFKGTA